MLPMSDRQVELFARQHGVHVAAEFLEEVDRQNSWDFARRPLDLAALIKRWNSSGDLGDPGAAARSELRGEAAGPS